MRRNAVPPPAPASAYAANYRTRARACGYLEKYRSRWSKRLSTRREMEILGGLLRRAAARAGPLDRVLDLPSGPGRLLSAYAPLARELVLADAGEGMARLALENAPPVRGQVRWGVLADALRLPFADGAFDLVVSVRLAHHLDGEEMFDRYLAELLRVSAGAVIFTFFSARSLKNRLRNVSVRLGRRHPKRSVDPARVREVAARAGFAWEASIPLSRVASGHLYVLLIKTERADGALRQAVEASLPATDGFRPAVMRLQAPGRSYGIYAKRYPARPAGWGRSGARRAADEWDRLLFLRGEGAPAARPLASWRAPGGGAAGCVVTEEVPEAVSLKDLAARAAAGEAWARRFLPRAVDAAVREIAALHAKGVTLGDPFAKNVLVAGGEPLPAVWFIDQPRASAAGNGGRLSASHMGDLARLYKGVRRALDPAALQEAFSAAYLSVRGLEDGAAAREALLTRLNNAARRLANETPLTALADAVKRRVRRTARRVAGGRS